MRRTRRSPGRPATDREDYLRVTIPLAAPLTEREREVISRMGEAGRNGAFFFEAEDRALHFCVRSLGPRDLEAMCRLIPADGTGRLGHVFDEIARRVDAIGSYGVRGGRRIFAGYDRERKVRGRKEKERARGPWFYALDHGFSRENNELPAEFRNRIVAGDSGEVLRRLPPQCVDIVVTSPPYNFGLGYDTTEYGTDWEKYFEKLFSVFDECIRVLKYGGRIVVNVQPLFSDYIPSHHIVSRYFMDRRLIWKGEILWEKNNYNCKYTAWGSWKSPSNPYLKYTWEFLEVFAKGDLKKEGSPDRADITADEFKKWVVARWSIAPERRMGEFGHPAMFPEELVVRALKLFSFEGDVVLDPFAGTGTTCVVAKKLNRVYLGIDISERYCAVAERRLREML
ncbi:MAG: site-specific DNA-methyltransferase [Methanolinea sp.]